MTDTINQSTAMEIAHKYVALKSDLRHKIMEFTKSKNNEMTELLLAYFAKSKEYIKDTERFNELYKKFGSMSDEETKEFEILYSKIPEYRTSKQHTIQGLEQQQKDKAKELTQVFREDNKELIGEYKQVRQNHKDNENAVEMLVGLLKNKRIAELDMDAFRKSIGFESVDVPRHIRDKQDIESTGVRVDDLFNKISSKEAAAVNEYFQGGDITKLAEEQNLTEKRVRQIRNRGLRRLRKFAKEKSEK